MKNGLLLAGVVLVVIGSFGGTAVAQEGELPAVRIVPDPPSLPGLPSREVAIDIDSGLVSHDGVGDGEQVVFGTVVHVPGAPWLRLRFDTADLSGDPAGGGTYLRLTSMLDGGVQYLNAEHVAQWRNASAYFNGDAVVVEVVALPGTGSSRLVMTRVTAGEPVELPESICGTTDDRTLISDNRSARHITVGCTSWVINDLNSTFLSAGHCGPAGGHVIQFNVPLSTSSGTTVAPPPQDQYSVEGTSVQLVNGGIGNDWSYYGVFPNSNTGLTPYQAYGVRYTLAASAPPPAGQTVRITGYGTVSAPVSLTWNQVEKTHTGAYVLRSGTQLGYTVDTTGGNSGSCVFNQTAGLAMGIHTHSGCTSTGGYNSGTAIQVPSLQTALANPAGICRSGKGAVSGPVYAFGDQVNSFGTCNTSTGNFAKISELGATVQGLAYNWNIGKFYAIDTARQLYTVDPVLGGATLLGTVGGTALTINGLGYDPYNNALYGIAQTNGQLLLINTGALTASTVGPARGGTVGGLEFDPIHGVLFGLNDSGGTKLITISTTDGAQAVVGAPGVPE